MTTLDQIGTMLRGMDRRLARLERGIAAAAADDDGWTRLPSPTKRERCPVSNWSGNKIRSLINSGKVRSKLVHNGRFYATADVRKLLTESKPTP